MAEMDGKHMLLHFAVHYHFPCWIDWIHKRTLLVNTIYRCYRIYILPGPAFFKPSLEGG